MEERVYNFSAGPSQMPLEVLKKAQDEMLCYPGAGCSVMEMSHRSSAFDEIIDGAEETLRRLMEIPDDYAVLFMQGGATTQFSMVPMNLARQGDTFCYMQTGQFATKAKAEEKPAEKKPTARKKAVKAEAEPAPEKKPRAPRKKKAEAEEAK